MKFYDEKDQEIFYLKKLYENQKAHELFTNYLSKKFFLNKKVVFEYDVEKVVLDYVVRDFDEYGNETIYFSIFVDNDELIRSTDDYFCNSKRVAEYGIDEAQFRIACCTFMAKLFGKEYMEDSLEFFMDNLQELTDQWNWNFDNIKNEAYIFDDEEKHISDDIKYYSDIVAGLNKEYKKLEKADKLNKELNEELTR